MKAILIIPAILLFAGCVTTVTETTNPDGTKTTVTSTAPAPGVVPTVTIVGTLDGDK